MGPSSLTRDRTLACRLGSSESQPLDHQGSPQYYLFVNLHPIPMSTSDPPPQLSPLETTSVHVSFQGPCACTHTHTHTRARAFLYALPLPPMAASCSRVLRLLYILGIPKYFNMWIFLWIFLHLYGRASLASIIGAYRCSE